MQKIASFYKNNIETIGKIFFLLSSALFIYVFFKILYPLAAPFVWGYVISLLLTPIVHFICRQAKIPRVLATIFALILVLLLIGLVFNLLISRVLLEGRAFFEYLPDLSSILNSTFSDLSDKFMPFYELLPPDERLFFMETLSKLTPPLAEVSKSALTASTNFVAKIPGVFLSFLLALISSFFFTKDRELIKNSVNSLVPMYFKRYLSVVKEGVISGLLGYIKAQGILMTVSYVICATGLVVLKIPYALFIGLLIAFVDALPVLGSGFILWPWIAFNMLTGNYPAAMGLGVIYLSILITRQTLEPKVLGVQIGIHPLITLMSIYIGLNLFGFPGIFIGPCTAIIVKAVYEMPSPYTEGKNGI